MRQRRMVGLVAGLLLALGLSAPAPAASAETVAGTTTDANTLPTAISWAMSASRAPYRHPLAVEYLLQLNLLGTWVPIPPSGTDEVVLQRQAAGTNRWRTVTTTSKTVTDKDGKPHYLLVDFAAMGNASYRLVYHSTHEGVDSSTSSTRGLKVSRLMGDRGVNRSGRLYVVGNVDPGWANRSVTFQRRGCSTCAWKFYRRVTTNTRGGYQVQVYAPRQGALRYRGFVRGTTSFVPSYTHTFIVRARTS